MIDEKKIISYIKKHINPYGKPFEGTVFEFGNKVMDYIKAMEKQPKTDWIPCKAKLPPMPKENPLFENKPIEIYLVSLGYEDYPIRAFWNGKNFTDGWSKLNVEAWMNLPQPYKKEGAENE